MNTFQTIQNYIMNIKRKIRTEKNAAFVRKCSGTGIIMWQ